MSSFASITATMMNAQYLRSVSKKALAYVSGGGLIGSRNLFAKSASGPAPNKSFERDVFGYAKSAPQFQRYVYYESACMITRILIFALFFAISGCTSIYSRPDRVEDRCEIGYPILYPGTRNDINNIGVTAAATLGFKREETKGNHYLLNPFSMLFYIIDLPFSFMMDTFVINYDIDQLDRCRQYRKSIKSGRPEDISQKT